MSSTDQPVRDHHCPDCGCDVVRSAQQCPGCGADFARIGGPDLTITTPDQFMLTIELGNDAMQTPDQVAVALRAVAERLTDRGDFDGSENGKIRDYNGNTVGVWSVA